MNFILENFLKHVINVCVIIKVYLDSCFLLKIYRHFNDQIDANVTEIVLLHLAILMTWKSWANCLQNNWRNCVIFLPLVDWLPNLSICLAWLICQMDNANEGEKLSSPNSPLRRPKKSSFLSPTITLERAISQSQAVR